MGFSRGSGAGISGAHEEPRKIRTSRADAAGAPVEERRRRRGLWISARKN
jgi:hypothetical protein